MLSYFYNKHSYLLLDLCKYFSEKDTSDYNCWIRGYSHTWLSQNIANLLSRVADPVYLPISNIWEFSPFITFFTLDFSPLLFVILMGIQWFSQCFNLHIFYHEWLKNISILCWQFGVLFLCIYLFIYSLFSFMLFSLNHLFFFFFDVYIIH